MYLIRSSYRLQKQITKYTNFTYLLHFFFIFLRLLLSCLTQRYLADLVTKDEVKLPWLARPLRRINKNYTLTETEIEMLVISYMEDLLVIPCKNPDTCRFPVFDKQHWQTSRFPSDMLIFKLQFWSGFL